ARRGGGDRHLAPAEEALALLVDHLLEGRDAEVLLEDVLRQEDEAGAVEALLRQVDAQASALAREELVRELHQDAGAVAGPRIAAAGSAVGQVLEDLQALHDDVVRALALHVGEDADAARVVLGRAAVEAFALGLRAKVADLLRGEPAVPAGLVAVDSVQRLTSLPSLLALAASVGASVCASVTAARSGAARVRSF